MRALAAFLVAAVLSAPAAAPVPVRIRYGGSSTIAETVLQRGIRQTFRERTGVEVQIVDVSGTGRGLEALAAGALDVSGSGRPLTVAERTAGLVGTLVAHDGLAVYVHRTNPVKNLSRAQLRDLLSGKAASWKDVGGRDVRVVPLIEPVASGRATVQILQQTVLGGAPFAPGAREIELIRDQLAEIARTEGALCVASVGYLASAEPEVRDGVRTITLDGTPPTDANIRSGEYPLARPILLVTRGVAAGDVRDLLDFVLSREGQAVVERFFVPVAPR